MNNEEYTSAVDRGEWPLDTRVPLDDPFVNANGIIQNLVLKPMTSVAVLSSVKGAVRANHWHRTDWHYAYVVSGSLAYLERQVGSEDVPDATVFKAGDMFFTPPNREHAMVFLEDTVIITMARNVRSHESHEADLVRVQLVGPQLAAAIVASGGVVPR